jgi:hypothetical protein
VRRLVAIAIAGCGGSAPATSTAPPANNAPAVAARPVVTHLRPKLVGFTQCPATVNIFVDGVIASTLEIKCPPTEPYVPGRMVVSDGPDVVDAPAFAVPPGRHTVRVEFAGDKAERAIMFPTYEQVPPALVAKGVRPRLAEELMLRISDEGMYVDEPVVEALMF